MKKLLTGCMPAKHRYLFAGLMLVLLSLSSQAQTFKATGVVTGKPDSLPLQGVTVAVKGGHKATQTDASGKFEITVSSGDILSISFIGYQPLEIPANATSPLSITLEQAKGALNEVVVTALGITRQKKSLGYAVQELKSKDISETAEPNLVNALEGKVAGVRVTNSQGDMGSSRIVIRGETSISGNNQPLFVVNGFPVDNSQLGGKRGLRRFAGFCQCHFGYQCQRHRVY